MGFKENIYLYLSLDKINVMSAIVENFPTIALTESGVRYGIRPVSGEYGYTAASLPISLRDEMESRLLMEQMARLFNKVEVKPWYDHFEVNVKQSRLPFAKEGYAVLKKGNSIEIGTYSPRSRNDRVVIDTVLRNTVLGTRLMDYWKQALKKSEREARKMLEEITPLANLPLE